MKIKAAILWELGQPLSVEEVELAEPRPTEMLVEVKAAGVCHSDLHPARGDWPMRTPLVLGHEGAGIVRQVGAEVTRAKVGDHVVFCWAPPCGVCEMCRAGRPVLCERLEKTVYRNRLPAGGTRLRARDQELYHFNATACFADHAVLCEEGVIPVSEDISFEALATLGCAVVTGVGAAINAARVEAGSQIVVIGAGGVGLNVIQGAVIAGAEKIIAIDARARPLELAHAFGATEAIAAAPENLRQVRELTGGRGADYVFDTVGLPDTLNAALNLVRKGGTVVLTGLSRIDATASINTFPFVMQEKRLIGSVYGSGQPLRDIPKLIELNRQGKLKLRELVARTYAIEEINEALDALAAGEGARGIIRW